MQRVGSESSHTHAGTQADISVAEHSTAQACCCFAQTRAWVRFREAGLHLQIWPVESGAGLDHRPPPACVHVQEVDKASTEDSRHDGRGDRDNVELDPGRQSEVDIKESHTCTMTCNLICPN